MFHRIDKTAIGTVIGVIILFALSIGVTYVAPRYIDPSWTSPSSHYQVQMHTVADPHFYIATEEKGGRQLIFVHHLKAGFTLLSFEETATSRILAPPDLQPYITSFGQKPLKLTSRLLFLRPLSSYDAPEAAEVQKTLQAEWKSTHSDQPGIPQFTLYQLYDPQLPEAFSLAQTDGILENYVDRDYQVVDGQQPYHRDPGVLYVRNPEEYRVIRSQFGSEILWRYDPSGKPVRTLQELKGDLGFLSRAEMISLGEDLYRVNGCWYCHSQQTRTLIQDCVLNGSAEYPAPPSSANEYIFQDVTFPSTRRIGPDLSRVAIKRPSRDWHKAHFWAPKTESPGSIMPSFRFLFDTDPRGSPRNPYGVPNYRFEALFQYLMTLGSRITPPTQAWWLGKDPLRVLDVIEGRKNDR